MHLFFDVETTGLPKNFRASYEEEGAWPRIVQLAYLASDDDGKTISEENVIIYPAGYTIPDEVAAIHGITTEIAREKGIPIQDALEKFAEYAVDCNILIAHNVNFDKKVMYSELFRAGMKDVIEHLHDVTKTCTMMKSTKFCGLKQANSNRPKWPKLQELHTKLFDEEFEGAHDALADIRATARCYWELVKLEVLPAYIPPPPPVEETFDDVDEFDEEPISESDVSVPKNGFGEKGWGE